MMYTDMKISRYILYLLFNQLFLNKMEGGGTFSTLENVLFRHLQDYNIVETSSVLKQS